MSMPWRGGSEISANGSAPSRIRVNAHSKAERVPLRQWATTGWAASRRVAAKASTSAARQCRRGDRDVVIGDPVRRGELLRLGGRQLPGVFAVGPVVDDRAHPGARQRVDVRAIEPAGNAQPGRPAEKARRSCCSSTPLSVAGVAAGAAAVT